MIELFLLLVSIIAAIIYVRWKIKQIKKRRTKKEIDIGLGYLRAAYKNKRL